MTAVLPHYTRGPANLQVSTLIFGGQFVMPTTQSYGTTDLTVKVATSATIYSVGVAGIDANVISTQTGAANTYGEPLIDISVLTDYAPVYAGGWDIWCWYVGQAYTGQKLIIGATGGAVTGAGSVRISGSTADFAAAFSQNVAFTSAGGLLELAAEDQGGDLEVGRAPCVMREYRSHAATPPSVLVFLVTV